MTRTDRRQARGAASRFHVALRWSLRALAGFGAIVALYFVAAFLGARITTSGAPPEPGEATVTVYFVSNGVHVDVWVPARHSDIDWTQWLPREAIEGSVAGPPRYVAFGWGERDFYLNTPTWDDLTFTTAARAVLWPTRTAVRVSPYSGRPRPQPNVHRVEVAAPRYPRLVDYLKRSFAVDAKGRPRLIDHPGYDAADRFFEGSGSYHAFRTCNVWTNGAVKAAGVPTGLWTPFESHVRRHLPANEGREKTTR